MLEMIKYRVLDFLADLMILVIVMLVIIIVLCLHEFVYKRIRKSIIRRKRSKYKRKDK